MKDMHEMSARHVDFSLMLVIRLFLFKLKA